LPDDNVKVSVTNETCSAKNDGRISIKAVQTLSNTATLTINGDRTSYPFTDSLAISLATCFFSFGICNLRLDLCNSHFMGRIKMNKKWF